jgi:biopolymer transport protein ExbD
MKFPRNTRLLRNPFDVAPFAAVFFLLVIFLMLGELLPTPGIPLRLPIVSGISGKDLPGTDKPSVAVAVDASGRFYFANQIVSEAQLKSNLSAAAKKSREPLTLVIHADKTVTYEQLVRLTLLARDAGIQNALLATLPRIVSTPDLP